jgi:hypothetical protein
MPTASTDAVARAWPVAGGNSLAPSSVAAPAGGVFSPAEVYWAAAVDPVRGAQVVGAFRSRFDLQYNGYVGPKFDRFGRIADPLGKK